MPFAFFYIFTAWVLLETYGHYDGPFAIILAGGFGLTLLAALLSGARNLVRGFTRIDADKNKTTFWKLTFASAVLYFCAAMWMSPGVVYPASAQLLSLLKGLLGMIFGAAAICVALAWFSGRAFRSWMRVVFWAAVTLLLAARLLTLFVSPNPYIDVFILTTHASDTLLSGLNPYTQTYVDLYRGGYDYAPGLNYWPAYYFWSAPFRLLGDIRAGSIAADVITTVLLLQIMAKTGVDESLRCLVVLSWLSFPVSLFVLEQAWIEPVIVMLVTGLLWCGLTKRWVAAGILLGILSGMKQHMLLLSVLTLYCLYQHRTRREFYKVLGWASATFTVTVAPFLLASGQAFIQQTIVTYLQREMRLDSLSPTAYLANAHGLVANNQFLITIYATALLVSLMLILRAKPAAWYHWPAALFVSYGVLFLAGKQAFCNYYYLLAFIALVASFISLPPSASEAPTGADASPEESPAPSPPAHARRAQSGCKAQRRLSPAQWTHWLHS